MSYDSDIEYYKGKIRKIQNAIPNIDTAISNYNLAIDELNKIKGVQKCKELKITIQTKINNLNSLKQKMRNEIDTYNRKIASLRRKRDAARRAAESKGD